MTNRDDHALAQSQLGEELSSSTATASKIDMGRILDQIIADNAGLTLGAYRDLKAFDASLNEEAVKYWGAPPHSWPPLHFNWDHREESQRFALDGMRADSFAKAYPDGLRLGQVSLAEFDRHLCHFNRRSADGLWEGGFQSSLARMIVYLHRGLPITPPLVFVVDGELALAGGNHRYAAAKASGLEVLHIYVEPRRVAVVERLIQVEWLSV